MLLLISSFHPKVRTKTLPYIFLTCLVLFLNQVFSLIRSSFRFCNPSYPVCPLAIKDPSASPPGGSHPLYSVSVDLLQGSGIFFLSKLSLVTSTISTNSSITFMIKSLWWFCESPSFSLLQVCLSVLLPDISYGMSFHQLRAFYFPSPSHPAWSPWMWPHYCPITPYLESIFLFSDFSPGPYVCISFLRFLIHLFQKHMFSHKLF